jgi:MtrB/PioB family decaheme-associated outer membrane protein
MLLTFAIAALAFPALAQEEAPDFSAGEVSVGLSQVDSDTISSKFLEYRDLPNAGTAPLIRFRGKKGDFRYDVWGEDISQGDQMYGAALGNDVFRFEGRYTQVPHNFGNSGKTLLTAVTETEWLMSDDLQSSFQAQIEGLGSRNYDTIFPIVAPSIAEGRSDIDIALHRNRSELKFKVTPPESRFDVELRYFHERRSGTRGNNGTSFGFNNVVETAEPVRYITQDFDIGASYAGKWGVGRVGFGFNDFSDEFDAFVWDNPFRGEDSTSGNAYLGPYSTTAGPKSGQTALPPSSQAWRGTAGATFKLANRTRLTADVAIGRWTQNEQSFLPFTTNTVIFLPDGRSGTDVSALPARNLDGEIDTLSLSGFFTTALGDKARVNARYRLYENDNKTPQIRFEQGYVRFDAVFEEIPRISIPFGFKSNVLDAWVDFDLGEHVTLEGGYKYSKIDRTFRETRETTENGFRVALDGRSGGFLIRGIYELASRDYDEYDAIHAEEQSFLDPGGPANQPTLRRYDQAKRDLQRLGGTVQFTPDSGKATLVFSYTKTMREYDEEPVPFEEVPGSEPPLGLVTSDYETFTLEGDFSPTDRATFYAFYSRENIDDLQRGRQSGGSLNFDVATTWTSMVADEVNSFGGGATFVLVPDEWTLDLFTRWQEVDGNNAFAEGGSATEDIAFYDDTKLFFVSAKLKYQLARQWALSLGGFYEDYELQDAQTGQVLNYMPGSFFLNANNGDYGAWVGYLNLTYNWN